MLKQTLFRSIVGSLISAVFMTFVITYVGFDNLTNAWSKLDVTIGVFGIVLLFLSYALRALRIFDHFHGVPGLSFSYCMKITFYHNFLNNFLPMRIGEFSFPVLLSHYSSIKVPCSISALIWFRVLDLHAILCIGSAAITQQLFGSWPALAILTLMAPLPLFVSSFRGWSLGKLSAHCNTAFAGIAHTMVEAIPSKTWDVCRTLLLTWINWILKLLALAWVLTSFSETKPATAAWSVLLGELTSVLPIHSFGGFGTYEGGIIAGLLPSGESLELSLEAAFNTHLFVLGVSVIAGALGVVIPSSPAVNQIDWKRLWRGRSN